MHYRNSLGQWRQGGVLGDALLQTSLSSYFVILKSILFKRALKKKSLRVKPVPETTEDGQMKLHKSFQGRKIANEPESCRMKLCPC